MAGGCWEVGDGSDFVHGDSTALRGQACLQQERQQGSGLRALLPSVLALPEPSPRAALLRVWLTGTVLIITTNTQEQFGEPGTLLVFRVDYLIRLPRQPCG